MASICARIRDIRATRALMNQQDHGNPLYIDPTGDTTPWHGG